jgi:dephospho-CoA kinase
MFQRRWFSAISRDKNSFKIMFLGAPGVGKGTYASRIAPMLQIPTISTGDLVRHEIKTGTSLGDQIKVYKGCTILIYVCKEKC